MRTRHDAFLIPGFFGFANLGRLRYFLHVVRFLRSRSRDRGVDLHIHVVKVPPTASLPVRAAHLAETVALATRGGRSAVHLVGHSTGGLDARLMTTPDVALPMRGDVERSARRVRSVIGINTPHHGTPLAAFFAMRGGQPLLGLLSLATSYILRFGHIPLSALARFAGQIGGGDGLRPRRGQSTLFDAVSRQLLADFSVGRRRAVARLLREVVRDQSLLLQLTPEAMDVFNAAVRDRDGVRYGSVVSSARPPGFRSTLRTGMDPGAQGLHAIYQGLHRITAGDGNITLPSPSRAQVRDLVRAYGKLPRPGANDGIVPTLSQARGRIIGAVRGDHLDVIGHFHDPSTSPAHFDWLPTGSGFDRGQFEALWERVLDFMLE